MFNQTANWHKKQLNDEITAFVFIYSMYTKYELRNKLHNVLKIFVKLVIYLVVNFHCRDTKLTAKKKVYKTLTTIQFDCSKTDCCSWDYFLSPTEWWNESEWRIGKKNNELTNCGVELYRESIMVKKFCGMREKMLFGGSRHFTINMQLPHVLCYLRDDKC